MLNILISLEVSSLNGHMLAFRILISHIQFPAYKIPSNCLPGGEVHGLKVEPSINHQYKYLLLFCLPSGWRIWFVDIATNITCFILILLYDVPCLHSCSEDIVIVYSISLCMFAKPCGPLGEGPLTRHLSLPEPILLQRLPLQGLICSCMSAA